MKSVTPPRMHHIQHIRKTDANRWMQSGRFAYRGKSVQEFLQNL